jgi:hypothetical protein
MHVYMYVYVYVMISQTNESKRSCRVSIVVSAIVQNDYFAVPLEICLSLGILYYGSLASDMDRECLHMVAKVSTVPLDHFPYYKMKRNI